MPATDPEASGAPVSALSPFRHRIFLSVWIASLASNFGGLIQSVGAAWLMTSISTSADLVALVQASTTPPNMLFSLMAGAIGRDPGAHRVHQLRFLLNNCRVEHPYGGDHPRNGTGGASRVLALSSFNATVQLSSPRWVIGRALALYQMATFGGMALGSWIWGVAAEGLGVADALLIAACMLVAGIVPGIRFSLPELKAPDLDPLDRWTEPDIALEIRPRSGPVVITIEYIIHEAHTVEFLSVMAERRRIRRRDGARHWTLMRDLENPQIWVERYHSRLKASNKR